MDKQFKFRHLVNQHQRLVFSIALRILGNKAEAEDATQEVYERAWKHVDSIKEAESKAWLTKVTRNLCIDKLRGRRPNDPFGESEEAICPELHSSDWIERTQIGNWLQNAITQLKEPYRSLITMLEIQQKSVREASEATGLSENQVKVYSHRAKKQLRKTLQGLDL